MTDHPTANQELRRIFDEIGSALALLDANSFRVSSNHRVARAIRDLDRDLSEIVAEDPETARTRLTKLDGIGRGSAEKILEYLESGGVKEHRELMEEVPEGLFEILEVPGVGPKSARAMWQQLGITSLAELKDKLHSPELLEVPRMGQKTIENLEKAIAFAEKSSDRIPIGRALPVAREIVDVLRAVDGVERAEVAGSLRRGRETIGDLDFLVAAADPDTIGQAAGDAFVAVDGVTEVLARGATKISVRIERRRLAVQADLRIVPSGVWGAALMYFTGSKEHNVRLRERAVKKGMRLNEYGLFEGTEERPQDHGAEPVAATEEADIYEALGLAYVPPEIREDRGELEGVPERLIEIGDIRSELHSHTTASDGRHSIEEMAAFAKKRGFHTLAITDHSASQVVANGLDAQRLLEHARVVREADARIDGIRLLAGSEVDILADGSLDYEDEVLAELDIVVASPHAALGQEPHEATERLLKAIRHPLVHVIGHPTGRLIPRREGLSPDIPALCRAAAEHGTALEINSNARRLDLRDLHARTALEAGCLLAVDTDAHHEGHFDQLEYGILTARRAGLTPERCINTWSAEKLESWLRAKR